MMTGEKILVVDDEPDIRILCKLNLEYEGYRVLEATSVASASEIAASDQPDLVLLDVNLPDSACWGFLRQLKAADKTAHIPVVLLSAQTSNETQVMGWTEGIVDYITKPFNPALLSRCVARALQDTDEVELARRRKLILEELRLRSELMKSEGCEDGT